MDYYKEIAEQIQRVSSNYYVLGYYIDEKWDGKYHDIKVEVKRQGRELWLSHRLKFPRSSIPDSDCIHLYCSSLKKRPFILYLSNRTRSTERLRFKIQQFVEELRLGLS